MGMDDRKRSVLLAIIQDYIATAEPVGSRTIARKYDLGVSPATIRNEMADLEELGYIEQPHTSAGRIPSDQGYRYYVDFLMEKNQLSKKEQIAIRNSYEVKFGEVAEVVKQTSRLLSRFTNYTSLILGPQLDDSAFKRVELIPLEEGKAVVMVITKSGLIQNRIIDIPANISGQDLQEISRVLNAKLQGFNPQEIKNTLIKEIYLELAKNKAIFDVTMELMDSCQNIDGARKVYLDGTLNMLNQPEFKNIEKVKTLLTLLDQNELMSEILSPSTEKEQGVMVKIGEEANLSGISDCSMITATYQIDGKIVGSIGVLGPTRMEYAKVISVVDFMTKNLSVILEDIYMKRK